MVPWDMSNLIEWWSDVLGIVNQSSPVGSASSVSLQSIAPGSLGMMFCSARWVASSHAFFLSRICARLASKSSPCRPAHVRPSSSAGRRDHRRVLGHAKGEKKEREAGEDLRVFQGRCV